MKMGDLTPLHAVVFRVGGLVCALPSGTVREILPAGRATRIPIGEGEQKVHDLYVRRD